MKIPSLNIMHLKDPDSMDQLEKELQRKNKAMNPRMLMLTQDIIFEKEMLFTICLGYLKFR